MERKFVEKLIILIILFIGVSITTGSIIGNYVNTQNKINQEKENSLILKNY